MTLLIVEESLAMCRLVRALIEELPVTVSECHDAARILAACAETQPDWVLMDLTLAGGDALAVARQLSALYSGTNFAAQPGGWPTAAGDRSHKRQTFAAFLGFATV
jgi:CheY-like chemotaxis protein